MFTTKKSGLAETRTNAPASRNRSVWLSALKGPKGVGFDEFVRPRQVTALCAQQTLSGRHRRRVHRRLADSVRGRPRIHLLSAENLLKSNVVPRSADRPGVVARRRRRRRHPSDRGQRRATERPLVSGQPTMPVSSPPWKSRWRAQPFQNHGGAMMLLSFVGLSVVGLSRMSETRKSRPRPA